MSVQGLVSREIVDSDDQTVTYREVWDMTAPYCPMIAIDLDTFTIDKSAVSCIRYVKCPHYGDRP
jgi:hypothetical protein